MNDNIRSPEMAVMLGVILAAQWFSSTADGFLDACGNSVFLPLLACGLALTGLTALLGALCPRRGLLGVCREHRALSLFPLVSALLFTLLASTALRDALSVFSLFFLPRTPRWFALALTLPLVVLMGLMGIASVSRPIKLVAPVLAALYLAVLVMSVWNQADFYDFFPLLGTGLAPMARTALSALSVAAWLPMLWIDRPRLEHPHRLGVLSCLLGTALCVTGYVFYGLLFPNGSAAESTFPLHRLSAAGGFSSAFQRTHALFIFVWLPVQMTAVGAGLCYAVRSLHAVFPVRQPRLLVLPPLVLMVLLSLRDIDHSPLWLTALLQTNMQALLLIPLLIPLVVGKILETRAARKEARHA